MPGYGFDKTFNIIGTLHIELVLDDIFAQMIKGSGLSDVLNIADLSVENAGNVLSNASGNTRTRYLMQVTAVALYKLMLKAHSDSGNDATDIETWSLTVAQHNNKFQYWTMVLSYV